MEDKSIWEQADMIHETHGPDAEHRRSRAVLMEKGGAVSVTPTETNVHGDALCFMVKTWARQKTTEALLNNGWRLAAVGGWRLAGGGPSGLSLKAVINKNKKSS